MLRPMRLLPAEGWLRLWHWLLAASVWVLVSAVAVEGASSTARRLDAQAEEGAYARAEVGAQAAEQVLERVLEAAETLLALAQARQRLLGAAQQAGAEGIEEQLTTVARSGRFGVLQVAIIAPDGWLLWSSVPGWHPIYLGDRQHFRVHLHDSPGLFVSEPLVGRASGRPSVQVSRRLAGRAGEFTGVAVISLGTTELAESLAAVQFGQGATALVIRRDGATIARSHDLGRALEVQLEPDSPLLRALAAAPSGRYRVPRSHYDGQPKLAAFRSLGTAPLVIAVALDARMELAATSFAHPLLAGATLAISLLTLAVLALALLWLERQRTQAALGTAQREREAAREQLAHTQRMEALGRLAGGVAHDFNNVLQVVLGGARSISRRSPEPAVQRLARMVAEAAERGASVTRRLLAFARRGELRSEAFPLPPLLAGVQEVLAHTLGGEVEVRVKAAGDLPPVLCDRGQLETVLVNLAVNARDAMEPHGGGTLTLSAVYEELVQGQHDGRSLRPGRYVRLAVADTGIGMDADTLARAAEPFFSTKTKARGTGLGLAMATGFAEQTGGRLQIESQPGNGATVTLWLPCAPPSAAEPVAAPARPAAPAGQRRLRVLLVDDESLVRETMADSLSALGWSVALAESGAEALDTLDAGTVPDLLVTDLAMPGMDGLCLIREARRLAPGLPALLITGHAGDAHTGLLATAAEAGPFAMLRKPAHAEDILAHAEALLQGLPATAPPPNPASAAHAAGELRNALARHGVPGDEP